MAPLKIQHNISTIFCLCILFGNVFLLGCGCFGKCFFFSWHSSLVCAYYDLSAQFISFATHYIGFRFSRKSKFCSLQFEHLRWRKRVNASKPTYSARSYWEIFELEFSLGQLTFCREKICVFYSNFTVDVTFDNFNDGKIFTVRETSDGLCIKYRYNTLPFPFKIPQSFPPSCFCFF